MVSKDTDTPLPADWAIKEALRRVKDVVGPSVAPWRIDEIKAERKLGYAQSIILAARLIEQHEEPPVDPDVEAVKRIIEVYIDYTMGDAYWNDRITELTRAVAQYKQEVENRG